MIPLLMANSIAKIINAIHAPPSSFGFLCKDDKQGVASVLLRIKRPSLACITDAKTVKDEMDLALQAGL
ncbi:hypothetical protein BZG80_03090 [Salinivibrio sp. MA440]|nr:hypothetical protein BZG75_08270 [Salinivibrio sp. AR640]OOF06843.1 hypothetical protein BZG80_03090 [Salinivibrio sp. MA440]